MIDLTILRFQASFATIAALKNDEMTRVFLAFEVGAGHDEVNVLDGFLLLRHNLFPVWSALGRSFSHARISPSTNLLCLPSLSRVLRMGTAWS
jgi:hypothetical protein